MALGKNAVRNFELELAARRRPKISMKSQPLINEDAQLVFLEYFVFDFRLGADLGKRA